jgi:hypothetical protein
MSVAEQMPPQELRPAPTRQRNRRWAGFLHVLDVRMKELRREPEVIFWVFGFPILLALGLGIAFRNKPADRASVVIVSGAASSDTVSMIQRSPAHASIRADVLDENSALRGFRLGKYDLVIRPDAGQGYEYRLLARSWMTPCKPWLGARTRSQLRL